MQFTSSSVANAIRVLGFPVNGVSPIELEQDGEVSITPDVHVQVGETYLIVGKWINDQAMKHWPCRESIHHIADDLRQALKD